MSNAALQKRLADGVRDLGIQLEPAASQLLLKFCDLLVKWNRTFNLTAITDPEQIVTLHLLDSLAVSPYLPRGRVIDVGSGGGLPGIPLAIAHPDREFVLLDSNGKKTRFLVQAIGELGLTNAVVVNLRVEDYRPEQLFDVVISRAFASVNDMLNKCAHLLAPGGCLLAMKGKLSTGELAVMPPGFKLVETLPVKIPGLDAERNLLMLERG